MGNCCSCCLACFGRRSVSYEELHNETDPLIISPPIPSTLPPKIRSRESNLYESPRTKHLYEEPSYFHENISGSPQENVNVSKRHRTAMELHQTETSYGRNLRTLMTIYQKPLERAVAEGRPVLAAEDIRNIFGGISKIADLHTLIHKDLSKIIDNWEEDCCIADLIIKYEQKLLEVYPPYVNYFDMGNDLLLKQEKNNPDFKAFLVKCFQDPQSLMQPLSVLLIRPVQRLPSMALLISDLHKRTPDNLKDRVKLEKAKEVLKKVLSFINEDKRKTEGKMKIFDIVYEVTDCPVNIISSNRLFISKVDVVTLSDGLYRSGERLALYLLTDVLEVAKWRNKSHGKSLLKHIRLLPLSNIHCILDMNDYGDLTNVFAVKYTENGNASNQNNANENTAEKTSILHLVDDKTFKSKWLNSLAMKVAQSKGESNTKEILKKIEPMDMMNFAKRGSKLHKKFLKIKSKTE